jgi:hypothetical protein
VTTDLEKAGTSSAPAVPDDSMTGLEDFDASTDAVMPRLRIVGKDAQFEDNLTNERHDKIKAVLLGLVKQRILWAPEVDDGEGPLCRSLDFLTGLPDPKGFPWKESGFERREGDHVELPCKDCGLKEWGTNPKGSTPWCSEQHTFPLMLLREGGDPSEAMPAILTLQRSGIKASKAYVSGFVRDRKPLYTQVTTIGLQPQKRGSVDYAVPILTKTEETDESLWPLFAKNYRQIRGYLQTPRSIEDEDTSKGSSGTVTATSSTPPPASMSDDEDPPF